MKFIQLVGSLLLLGIKLQIIFLIHTLKGGVILGIFPAILSVLRVMQKCMIDKDISHVYLGAEIKKLDKKEFIIINLLGWLLSIVTYLLTINLRLSRELIYNMAFHIFTVVLLVIILGITTYIFPLVSKYELPFKQYLFQGFLCSLTGIFETIAIVFGMSLAFGVGMTIPPLGFFLGIPLIMVPYAWFSMSAVARFEKVFYKQDGR